MPTTGCTTSMTLASYWQCSCAHTAADVIARFHRLHDRDVYFLITGTDEHGRKDRGLLSALERSPQDHLRDKIARWILTHLAAVENFYDRFSRTTSPAILQLFKSFSRVWGTRHLISASVQASVECEEFKEDESCWSIITVRFTSIGAAEWRTNKTTSFCLSKYQDQLVPSL